MSYSGQSNPPWQRNNLSGNAGGQSLQNNQIGIIGNMQYQQNANTQMYQNYNNSGQNTVANNINQIAQATQLFNQNAAVAYPQSRGLNPIAFNQSALNQQQQQSLLGQHPQQQQQQQNHQPIKTQSKIGFVTKLHTDCGFVDDEIFFHLKVCKGGATPKVGDRVLVEAAYNPHSPFEWNASRIQIVPTAPNISSNNTQSKQQNQHKSNHQQLHQSARNNPSQLPSLLNMKPTGSGYNAVPPPNEYRGGQRGFSPSSKRSPERRKDSKPRDPRERDRISDVIDEIDRKKRRDERERSRERRDRNERDRRDISNEKRERSPIRRISPKRRRGRGNPRYMVEIPKISLNLSKADVLELRRRYTNLYIPSDFFFTHIKWSQSFPPNTPFSIQRPCTFHVMHKSIESPTTNSDDLEPTDLDYTFSAKVMLMGFPPIAELYQKSLGLNGNQQPDERDDDRDFIHPSRLINFLVGIRGKNETMAIGGPWSPSLDGENPQTDPAVLIKTAMRNCKALTGIDLSGCTQWYRFVELYYHRSESIYKGKTIPGRVETVVIYLPDINSCMPTRTEWTNLQENYKMNLDQILLNNQANSNSTSASIINVGVGVTASSSTSKLSAAATGGVADTESNAVAAEADNTSEETGTCEDDKLKPTHFSQLDVKTMKLQNLRDELLARNLSTKGLKPQLTARLTKALNAEKTLEQDENTAEDDNKTIEEDDEINKKDENKEKIIDDNIDDNDEGTIDFDMTDIVVLDEYDGTKTQDEIIVPEKDQPKVMDEKEIAQLERRYKLPELPHILVHPSKTAKSGKFDCTIMSLSVLLDYRPEDTKERSFEVSLFAELFNEMLMRDFGFNIYNELMSLPEKIKEKDDDKKKNDEVKPITNEDDEKSKDSAVDKGKESNKNAETVRAARERRLSENDNKKIKDDKLREKKTAKRPHEDDSEDDTHSIRSDRKKKSKLVTYVAKRDLFLSFVYFDTTHCGFIYEKDLEELFYIIGLNLSRGQIRKLLGKVANKDAVHYRKLTDKVKDDETNSEVTDAKLIIQNNNCIIGNLNLLPIFPKQQAKVNNNFPTNSSMILHNGCLLDIEKLVSQMKRSEKAREEIEQVLSDLTKQHSDLQICQTKAINKIKDLQSETKSLSKKLRETEDNLFATNRKNNEHHSILQNIYDKISPIFAKTTREKERNDRSDRRDERDNKIRDDRDKTRDRKDEKEKKTDVRETKNREERIKMEIKCESKEYESDLNAEREISNVINDEKKERVEMSSQNPSNDPEK